MACNTLIVPLFCLLPAAVCAAKDLRERIIPNKITIPMFAVGILYAVFTRNFSDALCGALLAGGTILVCVLMGGAGGGDFKLAAALGAWFGFWNSFWVILIACAVGTAWGFRRLAKEGKLKSRLLLFLQGIFYEAVYGMKGILTLPKLPEDPKAPVPSEAIPFGFCLAVGVWLVWSLQFASNFIS